MFYYFIIAKKKADRNKDSVSIRSSTVRSGPLYLKIAPIVTHMSEYKYSATEQYTITFQR